MRFPMSLSNLITKAARVVGRHYQKECAPLGVTPPQAGIVWILAMMGPKSQVEIAALLKLEKTNVNAMVKKLLAANLVDIRKVLSDARKTEVFLTPEGKRLAKKLYTVDERVNAQILALAAVNESFNDAEQETIRRFLEGIVFS